MEFEGSLRIIVAVVWEDIEENADQVETFTSDIRDLEDWANARADKLGLKDLLDNLRDFGIVHRILTAVLMHCSRFLINIGIFFAPGDLRILVSWVTVCSKIFGGQISILVMTTMTGTLRASAIPRCSLLIY